MMAPAHKKLSWPDLSRPAIQTPYSVSRNTIVALGDERVSGNLTAVLFEDFRHTSEVKIPDLSSTPKAPMTLRDTDLLLVASLQTTVLAARWVAGTSPAMTEFEFHQGDRP